MNRAMRWTACGAALALSVIGAGVTDAAAQDGYLFSRPSASLKFESGYGFQQANSDLFDFVIENHTIERQDFNSPYVGGEFAVRVSEQVDIAISSGWQSSTIQSESREFIGTDDLPIRQVTEFTQVPVIASLKLYPIPRGRTLGQFAWVPRTITPYVGGGAGFIWYKFKQHGEFVDEETLEIFNDFYETNDEGFAARALAGLNVALGERFVFTIEGRYTWASADVAQSYSGFGPIDLDGLQVVGGLAVLF